MSGFLMLSTYRSFFPLSVALAAGVLAAACGDAAEAPGSGAADAGKGDARSGDGSVKVETAFSRNCALCHGDDGQGTSAAPQIKSPVVDYATWVVRNGRASTMGFTGAMPVASEAAVPESDLNEIFTYLGSFEKPTDGEGLYVRFCGNCHGADAKGGAVGKGLTAEKDSDLITMVRKGRGGSDFEKRKDYMPKWTAAEISDAEIKLVGTYVRGL